MTNEIEIIKSTNRMLDDTFRNHSGVNEMYISVIAIYANVNGSFFANGCKFTSRL